MKVETPCVGLDAACRAATALRASWQPAAVYDIEANRRPSLTALYSCLEVDKHLGASAGDFTRFSVEQANFFSKSEL